MLRFLCTCLALFAAYANAQTATVIDANGETIVQVITLDPLGLPSTTILQTLTSTSIPTTSILTTSTTSTSTSTTETETETETSTSSISTTTTPAPPVQQGPVGQPAPTVAAPGGVTPYTYTTVINGVTQVLSDIFTPTRPATVTPTITVEGTILDYSSWLANYGPPTSEAANAALRTGFRAVDVGWWGGALSWMLGALGGAWLVML